MPQHQLQFNALIKAPIEVAFAFLADHQNFSALFGGSCRRTKAGQGDINGLGSVRTIGPGPLGFDETIVRFDKPQRIEYRITRGGPLKNHHGIVLLKSVGSQTQMDYRIQFDGKFPLIGGIVAFFLKRAFKAKSGKLLARIARS